MKSYGGGILKLDGYTSRSNPDTLQIRFSCDGAQVDKSKSVITLRMTLIGFGTLIHSPTFNIPVAHIVGSKSDKKMLCMKLGEVYKEIANLRSETIRFTLHDGSKYYAKIKVYHVYDLKYMYSCLGHFGWSSKHYPHLFCKCKHLRCTKDYVVHVASNGEQPCERLTNSEYKTAVIHAKKKYDEIEKELSSLSVKKREEIYRASIIEENFGITHDGAFVDLLDVGTIMAEPLHCYLGLSTQHMLWLQHLRRQYNIPEHTFYKRLFELVPKYAPFTQVQICDESRSPAFIGRIWNLFWDAVKCIGATQVISKLFGHSQHSLDLQDTVKMLDKFQEIREEITRTWTSHAHIHAFKCNVKVWYELACQTMFEAKRQETVYVHILANIIPRDLELWFAQSNLGYGLFSMQGAEHLNKVTKTLLSGHTNNHFDNPRVGGGPPNDSFVTILRLSRWRFFVQHFKVHVTQLKREEEDKKQALLCYNDKYDMYMDERIV